MEVCTFTSTRVADMTYLLNCQGVLKILEGATLVRHTCPCTDRPVGHGHASNRRGDWSARWEILAAIMVADRFGGNFAGG